MTVLIGEKPNAYLQLDGVHGKKMKVCSNLSSAMVLKGIK
jgi:hypothetical protein